MIHVTLPFHGSLEITLVSLLVKVFFFLFMLGVQVSSNCRTMLLCCRKPIYGTPIAFDENEESDSALSQLQSSSHQKSVVSF